MNAIMLYKKLEKERERQCTTCSHNKSYCHIKKKISDAIPFYFDDPSRKYQSLVRGKCDNYLGTKYNERLNYYEWQIL